MLPLSHTTYNRDADSVPSTMQLSKLDANLLIDLDEDSEESSTESSTSDESSTYWIPKAGGIHILQRDFANAIAEQTGCILCPEPEYKRVRLISGNIQAALAKLQQLEPLLVGSLCIFMGDANTGNSYSWPDKVQLLHKESIIICSPYLAKTKAQQCCMYPLLEDLTPKELWSTPNLKSESSQC